METSGGNGSVQTSRDFSTYLPLYNAAISGDRETANTLFFQNNTEETEAIISLDGGTALHVAAQSGKADNFIQNLVELMSLQALALRDSKGNTALHHAARVGSIEAAWAMLGEYPNLLYMKSNSDRLPVTYAALYGKKETLEYFISVSRPKAENNPFEGQLGVALVIDVINSMLLGE